MHYDFHSNLNSLSLTCQYNDTSSKATCRIIVDYKIRGKLENFLVYMTKVTLHVYNALGAHQLPRKGMLGKVYIVSMSLMV